tara:strand:+ start:82 stop:1560 length:1479 start_codon:yes stop_codon:yes gene_type:complete
MSRPTKYQPERGGARTRLLEAARDVVRQQGFAATTIDDLCKAAGVTKGAFFHHFDSKEALGVAAATFWAQTTSALFQTAPYHNHDDPLDRVLAYVDFRKSIIEGNIAEFTCLVGTMVQETYGSSQGIREACAESIFGHAATLEPDIAAAMQQRGIVADWTPAGLARHTQAVLQGAFILAKATGDREVARESVDHLKRYIELLFAELPNAGAEMRLPQGIPIKNLVTEKETTMTDREGTPIWYELMTQDPDAAQDFYGAVMGWTFAAMPGAPGNDYRIASAGSEPVAGVMRTQDHANSMPDMWFFYVGVSDVDAAAQKVKALGGRIDIEPTDIPNVGRFAFVADPQGAQFYLMRGNSDQDSTAFAPAKTGHCSWNELVTLDQNAALDFYGELFGWEKGGSMPMGTDMGDYTFINHNNEMIGAVMDAPEKDTKPFWNFALQVADIDAAKKAVEDGGGTVRMGPSELPDDSGWLIQASDPRGVRIMFSGPRRAGS